MTGADEEAKGVDKSSEPDIPPASGSQASPGPSVPQLSDPPAASKTDPAKAPPMRVGYLINHYPSVSQTFIRREIHAVEHAGGVHVSRYTLRAGGVEGSIHPADSNETALTRVISLRVLTLLPVLLCLALRSPGRFLTALRLTISIGWNSDRGLLRHFAYLGQACALLEALRYDRIEHLHAHFGTKASAVAMICRELGGPPYSITIHGPLEFDLARLLSLSEKIARAKFIVAITEYCRSQIWRNSNAAYWDKVHVVGCGVDAAFFDQDPAPIPLASRVAFVGRLSDDKAPLLLIEAAALLLRNGVRVEIVFAGDGELRGAIEAAAAGHGLGDQVRILGFADEATVRESIRNARALVLPSFAEGLPVVIMEAFALGRPVLSTFVAGIPELIQPRKSGWLVPAGSVEKLAAALREVVEAPVEELQNLGQRGRESVMERHNAAKNGRVLAELFKSARAGS